MICDWWFKVDCSAAPGHYAESSEQLQRAQRLRQQKLRHVVRSEQGFGASGEIFFRNDARPAESIQKPAVHLPQGRAFRAPNSKINKRMDNNEGGDASKPAGENANASETLYARRNNRKEDANENDSKGKEIQETAETASFVKNRSAYNGYSYPSPSNIGYEYLPPNQGYNYPAARNNLRTDEKIESNPKPEKLLNTIFLSEPQPFNTRPTEKLTEMYVSTAASIEFATTKSPVTTAARLLEPVTSKPQIKSTATSSISTRRGSTTYQSSLKSAENQETIRSRIQAASSVVNSKVETSTASYESTKINTYSTARKANGKTKETPFYTPTIPTIRETTTTPTPSTTTSQPETITQATNSEIVKHALEMMESLKELDIDSVLPTETERYMGDRVGLEVPPSSGPNALHSLALYFANGDINNTKRMTEEQARKSKGISSVFLSDKTVTKYEELFPGERGSTQPSTSEKEISQTDSRLTEDESNDLETQHSKNPVLSAAGTPQLREIAQVFTHALSAYLQDPEQFRKILSEIRPTQPPPVELNEIPRFPGENQEFAKEESAYNIPRSSGTSSKPEDLEIFDFSDVTSSPKDRESETTTESFDENTTTDSSFPSTNYYPQVTESLPPASSNLADKTPASRLLTENLEKKADENLISRTAKKLDPSLRLPAAEINGGLRSSSRFNFDEFENKDNDDEDTYFPLKTGSKSKLNPYGFGVKPENSTPINDPYPTSLADTQAVPLRWGEELTTIDPQTTDIYPTVYPELLPPFDINGTNVFNIPSNDIQLPNEETDEHLHTQQSQSFVSSRNNIYTEIKKSKTSNDYLNYNEEFLLGTTNFGEKITTTTEIPQTSTIKGHFVTKAIPVSTTPTPETTTFEYPTTTSYPELIKTTLSDSGSFNANYKTTVSYTVFLDPLTINDGLMESGEETTVTPSPNTYLPNDTTTTEESNQLTTTPATTQRRGKSSFATTPLTIRFNEETNSVEPMQKRANEMFGNLNETQVNHLMNVMKKAEENKQVKRLILLLIQTCDGDDHNKTLEESRQALLNALIGMDGSSSNENRSEIKIINTRREKSFRTTSTTTTEVPITTYRSVNHEKYTSSENKEFDDAEPTTSNFDQTTAFASRNSESETTTQDSSKLLTTETEVTTEPPSTTTKTTTTTDQPISLPVNTRTRSIDSKPKFRLKSNASSKTSLDNVRHPKSLSTHDEYVAEPSQNSSIEHKRADARALELLRSLYSLASRWGK